MKALTISVAAYNAEKTLNKCLDSMVSADHIDDIEIIVVNDGSKDGTLKIAEEYENKYPGSVIVIDKENGGHGSTINSSLIRASGKYYKIVDSDDWVETENLDKLVSILKNSDEDLIVNSYYEADINGNKTNLIKASDHKYSDKKTYSFEDVALKLTKAHMHKMTFKTGLVKNMGPVIDEHCFYVDIEYVGFLLSKVNTIRFLDFPVYDYLLGYDEQSASRSSMIKRREQHKKVTRRMIEFYESVKTNDDRSEFLRRYIASMAGRQYKIYITMPVAEGKPEFIEFDKTVPDWCFKSPGMGKRMLPLVKTLRWNGYILYNILLLFVHFLIK